MNLNARKKVTVEVLRKRMALQERLGELSILLSASKDNPIDWEYAKSQVEEAHELLILISRQVEDAAKNDV